MLINMKSFKKHILKVNINALKQKHALTSKLQLNHVKQVQISCITKTNLFPAIYMSECSCILTPFAAGKKRENGELQIQHDECSDHISLSHL